MYTWQYVNSVRLPTAQILLEESKHFTSNICHESKPLDSGSESSDRYEI